MGTVFYLVPTAARVYWRKLMFHAGCCSPFREDIHDLYSPLCHGLLGISAVNDPAPRTLATGRAGPGGIASARAAAERGSGFRTASRPCAVHYLSESVWR